MYCLMLRNDAFVLQHIRGPDNKFADWTSRQDFPDIATVGHSLRYLAAINLTLAFRQCDTHSLYVDYFSCAYIDDLQFEIPMSIICALTDAAREVSRPSSITEAIAFVHNGRMGHHGVRCTWLKLNKVFPGYNIPIKAIEEFIDACPLCQKLRRDMADSLPAPVCAIVPEHCRHFVGFDTVTVTPADKEGHCCVHVMKLIPSRLVGLSSAKDYSALGVASALFEFFTPM